jgi:hypothetical protein
MPGQSNLLRLPVGQLINIGPRYVWNPSTGSRLNLSGWTGVLRVRDYAGGSLIFAISTGASTTAGRLKFSTAASGAYWLKLLPPATSAYGGVDGQYELRLSAAGRGGTLVMERGRVFLEDSLV